MQRNAKSIFVVEYRYLREYESEFETALAHESLDPAVLFDEKTRVRKSRETVPLGCPTKLVSIRNNRNWNRN
jgi:hypothetical protein